MSVWREEDHPRGEDGRFIDKITAFLKSGGVLPLLNDGRINLLVADRILMGDDRTSEGNLLLPNEQIPHSVGAMWQNYDILLPEGGFATFLEGTKLQNKEVIAGKGHRAQIECVGRLIATYGGQAREWKKCKAYAYVKYEDDIIELQEVHWYEEQSIGKVEFKVKEEDD